MKTNKDWLLRIIKEWDKEYNSNYEYAYNVYKNKYKLPINDILYKLIILANIKNDTILMYSLGELYKY